MADVLYALSFCSASLGLLLLRMMLKAISELVFRNVTFG
jgi:hypothetical protein